MRRASARFWHLLVALTILLSPDLAASPLRAAPRQSGESRVPAPAVIDAARAGQPLAQASQRPTGDDQAAAVAALAAPTAAPPAASRPSPRPVLFVANRGQAAAAARYQADLTAGRLWLTDDALWLVVAARRATTGQSPAGGANRRAPDQPAPAPPDRVALQLTFPGARAGVTPELLAAADASDLLWQTVIGGSGDEWLVGPALAVGADGTSYLAGTTYSADLPTVAGFQPSPPTPGYAAGYIAKLGPDGTPVYITYLGATQGLVNLWDIAADASGAAVVVGQLNGAVSGFPTTGILVPAPADTDNAVVTRLSPDGSSLLYSLVIGGRHGGDWTEVATVDAGGRAIVAGQTKSDDFPGLVGRPQFTTDPSDAFVLAIGPGGAVEASAFLVDLAGWEQWRDATYDRAGGVVLVGIYWTQIDPYNVEDDRLIVRYDAGLGGQSYRLVDHATQSDRAQAVAAEASGGVIVTNNIAGQRLAWVSPTGVVTALTGALTNSLWNGVAVRPDGLLAVTGGGADPYVAVLRPDGTLLTQVYEFSLVGPAYEEAWAIGSDATGRLYVGGVRRGGVGGSDDVFVAAIQPTLTSDLVGLLSDCTICVLWSRVVNGVVNVVAGNTLFNQLDLARPGPGPALALTRSYNSLDTTDSGFGVGWSHSYGLEVLNESATTVVVRMADGRRDRFTESAGLFSPPPGVDNRLVRLPDGRWTLTLPQQLTYTFDSAGRLTDLHDQAGATTSVVRAPTGLTITDPAGQSFSLTYGSGADAARFVALLESGLGGRTVQYAYTNSALTGVTDVRGALTSLAYDASRRLTEVLLPGGQRLFQHSYDAQGRVIEQRDAANRLTTLGYDTVARRTTVTDPTGRTTTFDHDAARRVPAVADGLGNTTTTTYDADNKPTCLTDARGGKTAASYDAAGNLLTFIDANNTDAACALKAGGVTRTFTYSATNDLLTETDELGRVTTHTYDAAGHRLTTTNALNQTMSYGYTPLTLASGAVVTLRTSETDALGRVTSYGYDALGQLTTITRPLGQVTTIAYDGLGRPVTATDPGGVAECREYDTANLLTATVANCVPGQPSTADQNVRSEHGYDAAGRRLWTRGPTGEVSRTFYSAEGWVERVIAGCALAGTPSTTTCDAFDPATPHLNRPTTYGYDAAGRPTAVTDPLGIVTATEYDAAGRPFRTIRNYVAGGPVDATTNVATTSEFLADGALKATIDALGRRTEYRYDAAGRQTDVIATYVDGDPTTGTADTDRVTRTLYDAAGNITATIDNYVDGLFDPARPDEDLRTVTVYDALNRPSRTIQNYIDGLSSAPEVATDLIADYGYDAVGNPTLTIDPLGRTTVTLYDALDRVTETVRHCTDGAGLPRTSGCAASHGAANDENIRTTTSYTARGQVDLTTDPLGRRTRLVYDGLGRVVQLIQNQAGSVAPADVTTAYTYDAAGRLLTTTDALGGAWSQTWTSAGWRAGRTDPTGRTLTIGYDGLGRPVSQTDPLGRQRRLVYDALGRATQQIVNYQDGLVDAGDGYDRDLLTTTEYDAAGRRLALIVPDGVRTAFGYDGLDRLTSVTENAGGSQGPANVTTSYAYDRRGLLTRLTDADGRQRTRGYDAVGRQTASIDGLGRVTTTTYDRAGRRLSVADPRPITVSYTYDGQDRLTGISAPGLTAIGQSYDLAGRRTLLADGTGTTAFSYDGLDRLTSASHSLTGTVSHAWDALGRRTSLTTSSGLPAQGLAYDAAGRLTTLTRAGAPHASATYDAAGRLATLTRQPTDLTTTHTYDGADRLTGLTTTRGGVVQTNFQSTFNRASRVIFVTETVGNASRTVNHLYDPLGRLGSILEQPGDILSYAYDLSGNRTRVQVNNQPAQFFSYDAANQRTDGSYDGAGQLLDDGTQTYTYDALGRLTSARRNNQTTSFSYTGDGHLFSRAQGSTTTRYTLDTATPTGLVERLGATTGTSTTWYVRGWGQELSREQAGALTWLVGDRLGSVRAEYTSAGTLTTSLNYDPWGVVEGNQDPADYGFTGEPTEGARGLVHLRARWYAPGQGRFLSRDPFAGSLNVPASLQPYAYAHNSPARYVDPHGADAEEAGWYLLGIVQQVANNNLWFVPESVKQPVVAQPNEGTPQTVGRLVGDVLSGVQGVAEIAGGAGLATGGTVVCFTVIGCVVGAPAVAAGAVLVGHGTGTAVASVCHAGQAIGLLAARSRSYPPGSGLDDFDAGQDRALVGGPQRQNRGAASQESGQFGQAALEKMYPGSHRGKSFWVDVNGRQEQRLVDAYREDVAREAKTGYKRLTAEMRDQIAKDAALKSEKLVERVEWHFFRSPLDGSFGLHDDLAQALRQVGIEIVLHP